MIDGAHVVVSSKRADADRALLRDVFGLPNVDAGNGRLIFGLPRSEVAVHPGPRSGEHELYFTCADVEGLVRRLRARRLKSTPIADRGWGLLTWLTLPGGGRLGIYQPRHARPPRARSKLAARRKR